MRANDKAAQLSFAGRLGFEIPPTIITNDPAEALAFHREHDGNIVSKTFATHHIEGADREHRSDWWFLETRMVSHRRTAAYRTVQGCPSIFQAYVPKDVELRITLVGDQVFPCEIHSQATHHTRYDWRRYDLAHTPHREHALPSDVRERCKALLRGYGLCFGAVDMVKTPDGRYVFLELNTTAEYVWIEKLTGMPMSEALTDLLVLAERGEGAIEDVLCAPPATLELG
jgi:glutathione synthase/RimK-type ligase-like ATP-grasp enzyme